MANPNPKPVANPSGYKKWVRPLTTPETEEVVTRVRARYPNIELTDEHLSFVAEVVKDYRDKFMEVNNLALKHKMY